MPPRRWPPKRRRPRARDCTPAASAGSRRCGCGRAGERPGTGAAMLAEALHAVTKDEAFHRQTKADGCHAAWVSAATWRAHMEIEQAALAAVADRSLAVVLGRIRRIHTQHTMVSGAVRATPTTNRRRSQEELDDCPTQAASPRPNRSQPGA